MSSDGMTRGTYFAVAGALTGLYFGTLITAVVAAGANARILPLAISEILFPVGCAMVLYVSGLFAHKE